MEKWEEIWAKQFGLKNFFAIDFSGEPIQRDFYKKYDAPDSWDIYYIEGKECISVSSKIFKHMPDHWEDNFFIKGKEYQFIKNYKEGFNVLLLTDIEEKPKTESYNSPSLDKINSFTIDDFADTNNQEKSAHKNDDFVESNKKADDGKLDPIKIWNLFYGKEIVAIDFAGKLINKYEYDTNHENAWKTDLYSSDSYKVFVASKEVIDERQGRNNFIIEGIEYNIIYKNNSYSIVNSEEADKILFTPELLCREVNNYFPLNQTGSDVFITSGIYYSSLLINLSSFPVNELEQLRMLLQKLLRKIDVFQDIFIYSNDEENLNPKYGNNCYIRIFFKANNMVVEDIKIFNLSLIIKNVVTLSINKIKLNHHLSNLTSFTMFLSTHDQNYAGISWFTNDDIYSNEKIPIRPNSGELIVDKFYFELFVSYKGYRNSFVILKTKMNDIFYLCNIDINHMKENINKNENLRIG